MFLYCKFISLNFGVYYSILIHFESITFEKSRNNLNEFFCLSTMFITNRDLRNTQRIQ